MYVCMYVCMYMYLCMYMYVCMYVCMFVYMYVHVCICIYVFLLQYVYIMYVCTCIYRYCDNVWTCLVQGVELKETQAADIIYVDKVKIVACDGGTSAAGASNKVKT